jgi:hypothetical protein
MATDHAHDTLAQTAANDAAGETHALGPAEMQAIADRSRFRAYSSLIGAAVSIVSMIAFVVIALVLLGTGQHGNELSEQSSCITKYTSILKGPNNARSNLSAEVSALTGGLDSQLGTALLDDVAGQPIPAATVARFSAIRTELATKSDELNRAIAKVNAEPSLTSATTNGFTFEGTHYPACVTVK